MHYWDDWPFDDGVIYVVVDSLGPIGAVRARTWEHAWECAIDEILPDADELDPENAPDADGNLPEGIHYRGSGVPSNPVLRSPLAWEDPNGCGLWTLEEFREFVRESWRGTRDAEVIAQHFARIDAENAA